MRQIWSAIELIAPHLHSDALVVGRSTVPVGTAKEIETRLQILTSTNSTIAWNPEFLREGFAVRDTRTPDRIVIGVQNSDDEQKLKSVYAPQLSKDIPLLVVDLATAELVKVSANAYLATKISFINAMSEIADKTGADVVALADAIGLDPRIGRKFLGAGVGFGGGCLPKDIRAFIHRAGELGLSSSLQFLKEVDEINLRQRDRVFSIAKDLLNGYVKGKRITVLGAAFKPDSDDVRDSPALDIAVRLNSEGANVVVHDPKALENAAKRFPVLTYEGDLEKALLNAELVLHLTEWMQYREIDPVSAKKLVRTPQMIDGRNMLNLEAYQAAGWKIVGLGRQPK
jgi:UDPglucose 6-dehydrogenase